ncbi:Toxin HipA [Rhodanobacter sp. Root179]|uniref:HipA domain-containing protein n=1 Tax=Rhodanobacter sp. Root179 TaxID=1736482 RepID=UPI0006F9CA1F|nr:HipA domain-containing protein [Rhodanobacter sp. Root179]KRB48695.1 toxin HipA [Rhodanobacter sp. Root179]
MEPLIVQLHLDGQWHDAMELTFLRPADGHASPCTLGYLDAYVLAQLDRLGAPTAAAVSATLPLDWSIHTTPQWPAFLFDIEPSGAARRFLLQRLGLPARNDDGATDLQLLAQCTPAPVGHLRIKSAFEALAGPSIGFPMADVVARDTRFLEYAYEQGAAIGGATGAGGEAPKLLLTEDAGGLLHPDATLDDAQAHRHWFVKFPRGNGGPVDQTILRAEHDYYRALAKLDIASVGGDAMRLEEATRPSLWLPRFDRSIADGTTVQRTAVESVYALAGVTRPGSYMTHPQAVAALVAAWHAAGQAGDVPTLLREYLRRDLLNLALGNSDNHGRNTAVLRHADWLELAPIYDLAPMVMDEEGITRTTKWPAPAEVAGEVDWRAACSTLQPWGDPQQLFSGLRDDAATLRALPDLLRDLGLPNAVFDHPRIALGALDARLRRWELLA